MGSRCNGFAIKEYECGDKYEGEWQDDLHHGQGRYTWADGTVYDGQWVLGLQEGQGKCTYTSGQWREYDGEWRGGKRHGWGKVLARDSYDKSQEYPCGNHPCAKWQEWSDGKEVDWQSHAELMMANFVREAAMGGPMQCHLPAALNSYQRMHIHALAESAGLQHISIGEGKERHMVLTACRPPNTSGDACDKDKPECPGLVQWKMNRGTMNLHELMLPLQTLVLQVNTHTGYLAPTS